MALGAVTLPARVHRLPFPPFKLQVQLRDWADQMMMVMMILRACVRVCPCWTILVGCS